MNFLDLKHLLWIIPLLAAATLLAFWAHRQRRRAITLLTRGSGKNNLLSSASPVRRRILGIALFTALVLALVAVLRPTGGTQISEHRRPAKNLIVLFDLSNSMVALDTEGVSRSEAAKLFLREFINQRPTDRVGLISFAGVPYIESPVTLDRSMLSQRINKIQPGDLLVGGTDLTTALREAQNLLTEDPPPGSAVIVFSDGDNVTGAPTDKVLSELKKIDVPVITVALGQNGVATTIADGLVTTADHSTLRKLSEETDGLFLVASPKEVDSQVAQIEERVDTIEINGENIAGELYERPLELYFWPLGIALFFLMIHLFLPLRTKTWHPLAPALAIALLLFQDLPAQEAEELENPATEIDPYSDKIAQAQEEERPLMLLFTGSDWSKLSITFEREILSHKVFQDWSKKSVIRLDLDLPRVGLPDDIRRYRRGLAKKFGVGTYPMAVFVSPEEERLGALTHDPDGPNSWIKRANAILDGKEEESDTAASVEFLPDEIRNALEDPEITDSQRSVRYYNKGLELEKAEPELSLSSKDRFKLLLDLYQKAAEAAPVDRPDLRFAARHKVALLHHRKGSTMIPKSPEDLAAKATAEELEPAKLLKRARSSIRKAIDIYKEAAPLSPGDEELSKNLALAFRNTTRLTAYLEYIEAYQGAVNKTATALQQEKRFVRSLDREVTTRTEVNKGAIDDSTTSIQELVVKAEVISGEPTILPPEGLQDYKLAEEDIALAPSPHRERDLHKSKQHIQDALDHLIDPQQMQGSGGEGEPQPGEGGEGEEEGESEGEEELDGSRQEELENPQGDKPDGEDEGPEEGDGDTSEDDLRRAERETGDLRESQLQRLQRDNLRKGRRVPPRKNH